MPGSTKITVWQHEYQIQEARLANEKFEGTAAEREKELFRRMVAVFNLSE